jgi:hypothetical protein
MMTYALLVPFQKNSRDMILCNMETEAALRQ